MIDALYFLANLALFLMFVVPPLFADGLEGDEGSKRQNAYWFVTSLTSLVLALARMNGVKTPAFQAIAHLWAGGLTFGLIFGRWRYLCGFFLGCLLVVEVYCFLAQQ